MTSAKVVARLRRVGAIGDDRRHSEIDLDPEMNPAAFPLASVVVLSFVDKLGTWWGILIVAATLPIAYAVSVSRDARARQIAAHGLSDDEDDTNVFGFFGITLPAVAAAIGGHFIRHGWGALIGGVVIAFIASAIFAVLISRNTPEPW